MKNVELRVGLVVAALALTLASCTSLKEAPSDQTITADIQAKLFQDPVLKTRDIQVSAQNGVVTLGGTVNTDLEKAAVERLANQETGVKQVVDQLTVSSASVAPAIAPQPAAPMAESVSPTARKHEPAQKARKHHAAEAAAEAEPAATAETAEASAPAPPPAPAANPTPAPVVDQPPSQPAAPAAPPPPVTVTVPAGTVVTVRMADTVDSATSQPGQQFAATVTAPVVVDNQVVIPASSNASVRLVAAKSSGRYQGSAQLTLELVSITVDGTPYSVESSTYQQTGASRGQRTAETVGGGSILGGLIGAIAGGGKGAAIGAGIGAAAGGGAQAASKKNEVKVPAEAKIDFTLKTPITVTLSQ